MTAKKVALSLFWRTFFLLLVLLAACVATWVQTLHALDAMAVDARRDASHLASLVRLSSEALRQVERGTRPALAKALAAREGMLLQSRAVADVWTTPLADERPGELAAELQGLLGRELVVATSVNGQGGLWLGFTVDREAWWLRAPASLSRSPTTDLGLAWLGAAIAVSLAGAVLIAQRINRPLRDLSFAASRIRGGEYESRLDETTITSEIREVNMGFNRMARELAKVEEDRAVMLAGISHDLRTPLARLRLEAEMSVVDDEARANMASDIAQLDAIIDKFMDYARPGETHLRPVLLSKLIDREAASFRDPSEIRITSKVSSDIEVLADEVELGRVFANLFENARRYGRTLDTGIAMVTVSHQRTGNWVICTVRDHGPGAAPEKLAQLTTPFFRGDAARTAATGAGLGLAIVDKAMQRMGGQVDVANAPEGGLVVHLRLRHARQARP
ncbi:MAG: HAMP domain-containing protein [Burkholderiaceae bacterium]|nr:HAMP domain-containing protein [Burkholderiaceae bacterium]